ncbi:hypothetical protein MLD38_015073 [Melastoma candidum]|uniref:Uncharacterized protein n=1 Tax=Melastoma candidum TaxID=119954 RepID=A0ACB9RFH4_9MYRT|nr:hypothetical protein MLD38_015073 [Melastoma candidum]
MSTSLGGGGGVSPSSRTSVAVAVKGELGRSDGGKGSRRAVRWALENLAPKADRFVLVHVMPRVTSIPTPSGGRTPIDELDENVVKLFVQDTMVKYEEVFIPFRRICKLRKVETVVLEDDDPAKALVTFVTEQGVENLVLGSCSSFSFRRTRGPEVPTTVLQHAPENCSVHIISNRNSVSRSGNGSRQGTRNDYSPSESEFSNSVCASPFSRFSRDFGESPVDSLSGSLHAFDGPETNTPGRTDSLASSGNEQSDEVEQLRRELIATVAMYERECEKLVHMQKEVQVLSSECNEESLRVKTELEKEEALRKLVDDQKAKVMRALTEVKEAKDLLAEESYGRHVAELKALQESLEKQKIINELLASDNRYRKFTRNEIEMATDFFSQEYMIGEGSYGKVYKCQLDHTPVAVKVLRPDAFDKKEEFLREVEVLSQLHHPHIVLLLGACPENGCLVYEYMERGSLEDYIYLHHGKSSLAWTVRFRIIFEIACGLSFLHNSKPLPIVHRDLKPGNILLGRNYVAKVSDVGLAKLISDVIPDSVTEYRDSILAGTIFYMDPEYQRTGTIRPKSDLYAFGVIILQLLSCRHPNGLLLKFEEAIENGSFASILDSSVKDWPVREAEELAHLALNCSKLRCRDRPDLDTEVLPVLKRLADFAGSRVQQRETTVSAPSHYYCPITQEVMEDPQLAADGYSYEHRAMRAWLEKHRVSPVTRMELKHSILVPNHTLRAAIQEWRSRSFPQVGT